MTESRKRPRKLPMGFVRVCEPGSGIPNPLPLAYAASRGWILPPPTEDDIEWMRAAVAFARQSRRRSL